MTWSIEENKERIKKDVQGLHKYHPKYIFLTETSAIPSGFALKEAWKKVYPDEKPPVFYRIDPGYIRMIVQMTENGDLDSLKKYTEPHGNKKIEEFFKKRIKDKNAQVFIYDEESGGTTPKAIAELLTDPVHHGFSKDIECKNVKMVCPYHCSEYEDLPPEIKKYAVPEVSGTLKLNPGISVTTKSDSSFRVFPKGKILRKFEIITREPDYEKRRIIQKIDRYNSKDLIKHYKFMGREAGEELHQELEKKKSLEKRVEAFIGISGLIASLIFLSSNITGNVIGNLNQSSSNIIGQCFFLMGLIGAFFYFKNKK